MGSPTLHLSLPRASLFRLPASDCPNPLPPPPADFTYAPAFSIPPALYDRLLHISVPITFALIYAVTVTLVNQVNKQRGNKPWAFSKTPAFFFLVIAHNVFLAAYSGWTFLGMASAVSHTWPGLRGKDGFVEAVDALCKMHGPRGLGQAAVYNSTANTWTVTSHTVKLAAGGQPDSSDVGRLWNEGLAFYGWLFYLSKFYEVLDTAIILAKGKSSSLLQIYHHAGAMLCMWAGIRYMASAIWMFVFVNAGIHAMMYTYYTVASLSFHVPQAVKETLTTMQIVQFVFGGSYAFAHLFISYSIPVSIPYNVISSFSAPISSISTAISSATAAAAASGGVGNLLKKIALRAAGEEGLAENVAHAQQSLGSGDVTERLNDEIRYRIEYQTVPCIDTSGEVFAILLNVAYLMPLTVLFVKFFIRSYINRSPAGAARAKQASALEKAGQDALKGVEREMHEAPLPTLESMKRAAEVTEDALE